MNFGDIFVAGKKEKVEEQLKVMAVVLIIWVNVVLLAYIIVSSQAFTSQSEQATFTSEIETVRQQVTDNFARHPSFVKWQTSHTLCSRSRLKLQLCE